MVNLALLTKLKNTIETKKLFSRSRISSENPFFTVVMTPYIVKKERTKHTD